MSSLGTDMLAAIRQVRKLHGQVKLLLRAADVMMDEAGWERAGGNMAVTGSSSAIYGSANWGPDGAFSFYKNAEFPHVLALVCVFLDDVEEEGRLVEPLACASWFDYGQDGEVNGHWDYWYYRHHLGAEGRRDDGQWVVDEAQPDWTKHKHGVRHVHTMALPLVSIADGDQLKAHIVEPLLASIGTETAN